LLSDFDVFNCVLNNRYLSLSEEDDEQFYKWYESLKIKNSECKNYKSQDEKLQILQKAIVESWVGNIFIVYIA